MRFPLFRSLVPVVVLVVWGAVAPLGSAAAKPQAAKRPNVVLIMTDDQGYGDLGCLGNKVIRTPAIDKFYTDSVRLTDYHVDPTCSPTRSALMTGRYSSRTGVWHTIMGRSLMHPDENTVAELFAANGYQTGCFGKWHLGDNYPCRPQDQGFHETLVHGGGGVSQTPDYWGNDYFDDTYWHNGKPTKYTGYCTDVFFDGALKFIEANKSRPFFCYIPTNAAHGPFNVAKKYSEPYRKLGVPSPRAEFYGMITNIDENMARMRKRLKELGLEDNTILIFTTDNGTAAGMRRRRGKKKRKKARKARTGEPIRNPQSGHPRERVIRNFQIRNGYNAGMRGTKGSEYDGGHRVPFFVRWPKGGITGGRNVDRVTAHIDVLPTLADLCGIKVPARLKIDGSSLAGALRGDLEKTAAGPQRTLFVHSQRLEHPQKWRKAAVMTDRWRLVLNGNRRELFDIKNDPGQKKDVKDEHPKTFKTLQAAYETWYASIGTRFNDYVRISLGSKQENPARLTCHDWHTNNKAVPWNQGAVKRNLPANGFWAVHVERPGTYEVTLRTRPKQVQAVIPPGKARLKIGGVDETKTISQGASGVTFRVKLKAGDTRLQTWLGEKRGAYFVDVKYVD